MQTRIQLNENQQKYTYYQDKISHIMGYARPEQAKHNLRSNLYFSAYYCPHCVQKIEPIILLQQKKLKNLRQETLALFVAVLYDMNLDTLFRPMILPAISLDMITHCLDVVLAPTQIMQELANNLIFR